jgi:hypothetical protein
VIRALLGLLLAIGASAAAQAQPVRVTVDRTGDSFVAEFVFPRAAPAWGFFRSSPAAFNRQSWRQQSWQVLTPGVRLERRGSFDALTAGGRRPVPRVVRVRFTPFTGDLLADYVPALRLGGSSVAVFDGHFAVFSANRADILNRLPVGGDPRFIVDTNTAVQFRGRNLRLAGDVEGYRRGNSEGTYGLYEVPRAVVRSGVATVIDGDLPKWIADDLAAYTPRVIDVLTSRLGPSGVAQPTILAAWEGPNGEGASMNGGTLKGLILMRFEGQSALLQIPALADMAHWFIAHEASHFWLGQAVHYATPRDSWIMEGGADLLAMRTVQRLNPAFNPSAKLNEALRDCSALAVRPVATAIDRNEVRANYACGAIFALVAERANKGDFFAFVRRIVDANRVDRKLTSAEWLAAFERSGGERAQSVAIRELVERGSRNPKVALAGLLRDAGIAHTLDATGVPQLQ